MQFSQLKQELDAGKIRNLYLFTGEERDVLNKYIKRISPHPVVTKDFKSIMSHLSTKGLFDQRKTYVIENDKSVALFDIPTLQRLAGKNTIILLFDEIDKRVSFFKKADSITVNFAKFSEGQLVGLVQKYLNIDDQTAAIIARYCGNDVSRVENECHKLVHLDKPVTPQVISELIQPPLEDRIFDMVDYVVRRDAVSVFRIYNDLLELKESPIKIVSLLYTKFKQIFLVQSHYNLDNASIIAKSGLTSYQVQKTREFAGMFDLESLLAVIQAIQKAEVSMKTGEMNIEIAMDHLFLGILNIGR